VCVCVHCRHLLQVFVTVTFDVQTTLAAFPSRVDKPWYGAVDYAPWYTGAFVTMAMFFIYTAASNRSVSSRRRCVYAAALC
jgi:hypothetical protein